MVTQATGHLIYQLDKKPAVSIYEDYLGLKREDLKVEPLANLAITYPLGTHLEGQSEYLLARCDSYWSRRIAYLYRRSASGQFGSTDDWRP